MALGQFLNRGKQPGPAADEPRSDTGPDTGPEPAPPAAPLVLDTPPEAVAEPVAEAEAPLPAAPRAPGAVQALGAIRDRVAAREALMAAARAEDSLPRGLSAQAPVTPPPAAPVPPPAAEAPEDPPAPAPRGKLARRNRVRAGKAVPPAAAPDAPPPRPAAATPAAPAASPPPPPEAHPARPEAWSARQPLAVGVFALALLVGGIGAWAVGTQLTGAVVAPGMVEVESNRQVIQHPDGGVVRAIRVRDGDTVEAGDVLIELDGTRLASQLAVVEGQLVEIAARRARLTAERDDAATIDFPPDLLDAARTSAEVAETLAGERALFTARRETLDLQSGLVDEQNRQIDNRVEGIESQLRAARTQIGIARDQLADQERLLEQGLTQSAQVLDLRREMAELEGRVGAFEAEIAGLRGEAAGNEIALLQLRTQRREEAVSMLRDLEFSAIELAERRADLAETLSRLDLRAPVGGIVYDSKVFALQSVVQPAEPLMYIVPQDQPLVVAARVGAIDVDEVYLGQEVSLRFPAFDQRVVPELKGQVARIAADATRDERTGETYYEADILPEPGELAKLGDQALVPGMPVDAFIRTRERTALAYLTEPFTAFFARAFRE